MCTCILHPGPWSLLYKDKSIEVEFSSLEVSWWGSFGVYVSS